MTAQIRDQSPQTEEFLREVLEGLSASPKELPPKYFYDDEGQQLFAQICETPEYYVTRTELGMLPEVCETLARDMDGGCGVVELGVGASAKVQCLLDALHHPAWYSAVEINRAALESTLQGLRERWPQLPVEGVVADFTQSHWALPQRLIEQAGQILGFLPGSTIGNFAPGQAQGLLASFLRATSGLGQMLVGIDLRKDPAMLQRAYDDAGGVTAAFNRNLLRRMQRELGAVLDAGGFSHLARYDEGLHRIEMHLRAEGPQTIQVGGRSFELAGGETICTEHSWKFSPESFAGMARQAGYSQARHFTDPQQLFALVWLRP